MLKTKADFVRAFHLTKGEKVRIADGRKTLERTCYTDPHGEKFVFYDNDLRLLGKARYKGIYNLVAAHGWYH